MKIYKSLKIAKMVLRIRAIIKKRHGKTLADFKQKLKKLKITTSWQYQTQRKNLNLPGAPQRIYENAWVSWTDLFDRPARRILIPTYAQWKKELRKSCIRTSQEYKKMLKSYKGFPHCPDVVYKDKWEGWQKAFGRKSYKKVFLPWKKFLDSVRESGVSSLSYFAYRKTHNLQTKWPSDPRIQYRQWVSWYYTLEKKRPSYKQLLSEVRKAGLKNCSEYFKEYKKHPGWPNNPARGKYYSDEWVSWKNFLGLNYRDNRGRPRKNK